MPEDPVKAVFETAHVAAVMTSFCADVIAAAPLDVPQMVVGWSARELLVHHPELAVLREPGTVYVRLPASLDEIRRGIADARSREAPPNGSRYSTPTGQLWCAFADLPHIADPRETLLALEEIDRFTHARWPGWYMPVVDGLRDYIERGRYINAIVSAVKELVEEVAVMHVLRPLETWAPPGQDAERVTFFYAALDSFRQDLSDQSEVHSIACGDPWWRELSATLTPLEGQLEQHAASGITVDETLRGKVRALIDIVAELDREPGSLPDRERDVGRVIDLIGEIDARRAALLRRLAREESE
jgi:hypothetical protein